MAIVLFKLRSVLAAVLALLISTSVLANSHLSQRQQNWKTMSDVGAYGLVGLAFALPSYHSDWQGLQQAGLSIGSAAGMALIGKNIVSETRPDGSDNNSFPSGHTTNAFAAATTLHIRYGWQVGLPAYGVATLVAAGRVEAERHYWRDVAAGAALGSLSAWIFTDKLNEQVQVLPWVAEKQAGIVISAQW